MSKITRQGEKASSFAMTCNLLSQYIKENGRPLGDLGLGLVPRPIDSSIGKSDTYRRPTTTMSLLPGLDVSDGNATKSMDLFPQRSGFGLQTPAVPESREPEKSQLTIFYRGKVLVFDNFPADKARDLTMIASKGCSPSMNTGFAPQPVDSSAASADLPLARKASLHRFLEKRKDRINARAPYQMNQAKGSPEMEQKQSWWRGLEPSLSSDCRR